MICHLAVFALERGCLKTVIPGLPARQPLWWDPESNLSNLL